MTNAPSASRSAAPSELEGYEIGLAGDGSEALQALKGRRAAAGRRHPRRADAGIDGLEVCRRLRAAGNSNPGADAHRTREVETVSQAWMPVPTTT